MTNPELDEKPSLGDDTPVVPAPKSRYYLYGVVPVATDLTLGAIGLASGEVSLLRQGAVAAVVSRISGERIRPERRNLAAHAAVLKAFNDCTTVLPMSFGTISASEQSIHDILQRNQEVFVGQLKRVAGRLEMGLRVEWDVPNVFEFIVSHNPELAAERDEMLQGGQPNRDEMIRVGQQFERTLNRERDRLFHRVEAVLLRHGAEVKRLAPRTEREVLNLACLIARNQQDEFEAVVSEAANGLDSNYLFNLSGPWAPHNFVAITL